MKLLVATIPAFLLLLSSPAVVSAQDQCDALEAEYKAQNNGAGCEGDNMAYKKCGDAGPVECVEMGSVISGEEGCQVCADGIVNDGTMIIGDSDPEDTGDSDPEDTGDSEPDGGGGDDDDTCDALEQEYKAQNNGADCDGTNMGYKKCGTDLVECVEMTSNIESVDGCNICADSIVSDGPITIGDGGDGSGGSGGSSSSSSNGGGGEGGGGGSTESSSSTADSAAAATSMGSAAAAAVAAAAAIFVLA